MNARRTIPAVGPGGARQRWLIALALSLTLLAAMAAAVWVVPRWRLGTWHADLRSGDATRMAQGLRGLVTLAEVPFGPTAGLAEEFHTALTQLPAEWHPAVLDAADRAAAINPDVIRYWRPSLAAANDAEFYAAFRLLRQVLGRRLDATAAQRLRYAGLMIAYSPDAARPAALDGLSPMLRGALGTAEGESFLAGLERLAGPSQSPATRAAVVRAYAAFTGKLPESLRNYDKFHIGPGESPGRSDPSALPLAAAIEAVLWLSVLEEPGELWRDWLNAVIRRIDWPSLAVAPAAQPATQQATQPGPDDLTPLALTAVRMAQARLGGVASLPRVDELLIRPLADRRAIAAGLRWVDPATAARYAEHLLNHEPDAAVRARAVLALSGRPVPGARAPLLRLVLEDFATGRAQDAAWASEHPVRLGAIAALASHRQPAEDDPLLEALLLDLLRSAEFTDVHESEAIELLRTLGERPSELRPGWDSLYRTAATFGPSWQLRREAARTWLLKSRQPAAEAAHAGSDPAPQLPAWAGTFAPFDVDDPPTAAGIYPVLLRLDASDTLTPGDLAQLRLMVTFDAWKLGAFPPAEVADMLASHYPSERIAATQIALAAKRRDLLPTMRERLQFHETDALTRAYLELALAGLGDPPNLAAMRALATVRDLPAAHLLWARLAASDPDAAGEVFADIEQPRTLLQVDRFEELLRHYVPELPEAPAAGDLTLRSLDFERQRRWWRLHGPTHDAHTRGHQATK